ncbi:MAG: PEP-CTERM sorting domain-containing protein [Planctomycetota bacterium]
MKTTRQWRPLICAASAMLAVLALLESGAAIQAAMLDLPDGLSPGDEYRIAFVTNGRRGTQNGLSIVSYDGFVNVEARAPGSLVAFLDATWFAIASTPTTDAKLTTGTDDSPAGENGVPIYLVDAATRIADNYDDLWDGSLDAELNLSQSGDQVDNFVWTGTLATGVRNPFMELGLATQISGAGTTQSAGAPWINATSAVASARLPVYAISEVLVAVPEPTSLALLMIGTGAICVANRRSAR